MKKEIKKIESVNNVSNLQEIETVNQVENNEAVNEMLNEVEGDELFKELQAEAVQQAIEQSTRPRRKQSKWNGVENWLINRMNKILEHNAMSEKLLDEFVKMIDNAKGGIKEREIKRIDEEIARLTALKETLK